MGGSIFVGIRYKDAKGKIKEVLMDRWTNDIPWRFMQPSFLDQGEEFNKFIAEAKPGNEWPKSEKVDKVIRGEYGIILIDFITRNVLSRNDYVTPGTLIITSVSTSVDYAVNGTIGLIKRGWIKSIEKTVFDDKSTTINIFPSDFENELKDDIAYKRAIFYEAYLIDTVFNIDDKTDRYPKSSEVKRWMKKNKWTSKIDEKSFRIDE